MNIGMKGLDLENRRGSSVPEMRNADINLQPIAFSLNKYNKNV